MGKPAARVGDPTAHGGAITGPGCPTVLIGGMPAARLGDTQACPLVTPTPVPVPHATGPMALGSTGVLIGGQPAARMGDMATCVGPPTTIAMGCPTVLIGEVGGGGGGGGGVGGAAKAASQGAHAALVGTPGVETPGKHWIEYQFVDAAGIAVSGVSYEYTDMDDKVEKGVLKGDGRIRRGGYANEGNCKVKLFAVHSAKWSVDEAKVGDVVKLSADAEGYEDGTKAVFKIYEKENKGFDYLIADFETEVKGEKVETEWIYEVREDEGPSEVDKRKGYSSPRYYFIVYVARDKAKSGLLKYQDWIEIELKDQDDHPIADKKYVVYLKNGEIRKGKLDKNGYAKEEKVPPGKYRVEFPEDEDKSLFKSASQ